MQILTTGKNLDIGSALRGHIESRLASNVDKYFDGAVRAHVIVERQRSSFRTECTVQLTTGLTLNAEGRSAEAYASIDIAIEHLEKRLRRYKRRLRNYRADRRQSETFDVEESLSAREGEAALQHSRQSSRTGRFLKDRGGS